MSLLGWRLKIKSEGILEQILKATLRQMEVMIKLKALMKNMFGANSQKMRFPVIIEMWMSL